MEITCYSSKGRVHASTNAINFLSELSEEAGEISGSKMDAVIRKNLSPGLAEKLVGKGMHDRVSDDPVEWNDIEDPRQVSPGFFLFALDVDFEKGVLSMEDMRLSGEFMEYIFPDDDFFGTELDEPEYSALMEGLSFSANEIELLAPHLELRLSSGFNTESRELRASIGRPAKWDWDGAFAFVVSQAQTPDGLPTGQGAQARIEEMMASWFIRETGNSPAASQIRARASRIIKTLEKPISPEKL